MSFRYFLFCAVLLITATASAQTDSLTADSNYIPKVVQFSGVIVEGDSLMPIPYSNVFRSRDMMGVVSNNLGFFTLPAFEGDTIVFSNIGYKDQYFKIPRNTEDGMLSVVQLLVPDTILLSETQVYPWPANRAALRKDLLALELPDDVLSRSQNNLDPLKMDERLQHLMVGDASASFTNAMNRQVLELQSMGQARNVSLLNPFAWAQFLSALNNGSLRRQ